MCWWPQTTIGASRGETWRDFRAKAVSRAVRAKIAEFRNDERLATNWVHGDAHLTQFLHAGLALLAELRRVGAAAAENRALLWNFKNWRRKLDAKTPEKCKLLAKPMMFTLARPTWIAEKTFSLAKSVISCPDDRTQIAVVAYVDDLPNMLAPVYVYVLCVMPLAAGKAETPHDSLRNIGLCEIKPWRHGDMSTAMMKADVLARPSAWKPIEMTKEEEQMMGVVKIEKKDRMAAAMAAQRPAAPAAAGAYGAPDAVGSAFVEVTKDTHTFMAFPVAGQGGQPIMMGSVQMEAVGTIQMETIATIEDDPVVAALPPHEQQKHRRRQLHRKDRAIKKAYSWSKDVEDHEDGGKKPKPAPSVHEDGKVLGRRSDLQWITIHRSTGRFHDSTPN